jgi:4-amino-4-deoxy-L-arabinose transferase-like glycosyltransferase
MTILILSSVFFFRDLTPDNELKYISIIEEAFRNNKFMTFYNHGVIYADKPPLYFWILILVKMITGSYNKVMNGLFSIIPAIIVCMSMMRITKKELSESEGFLGLGMLMTTVLFMGGSLVLRMDMLMIMFIVLALECFYRIYINEKKKYDIYFMYLYIFLALFTKGPVGILFPLITILLFLFREKQLKKGMKFRPFMGLGIVITLCIIWFIGVYLEGGKDYLYDLTVKQTAGRAYKSFRHVRPFYYYLKQMWVTFLPWSFLYIFTFFLSFIKKLEKTSLERFLSSAIIGNFIFMSAVSSKLEIYLLPIYPFLTFYTLIMLRKIKGEKLWQWSLAPFSILIALALPGTLITSKFVDFPIRMSPMFYTGLGIVSVFGLVSLVNIKKKDFNKTSWSIVLGFMIIILSLSFKLPEVNKNLGLKVLATHGMEVSKETGNENYVSFNFEKAENMDVYLKKEIPDIENTEKLKEVFNSSEVILFVRKKDIKRNTELREILGKQRLVWNSDNYYLYTNN